MFLISLDMSRIRNSFVAEWRVGALNRIFSTLELVLIEGFVPFIEIFLDKLADILTLKVNKQC